MIIIHLRVCMWKSFFFAVRTSKTLHSHESTDGQNVLRWKVICNSVLFFLRLQMKAKQSKKTKCIWFDVFVACEFCFVFSLIKNEICMLMCKSFHRHFVHLNELIQWFSIVSIKICQTKFEQYYSPVVQRQQITKTTL